MDVHSFNVLISFMMSASLRYGSEECKGISMTACISNKPHVTLESPNHNIYYKILCALLA